MNEQLHYFGGPYKDYFGRAEYDSAAGCFHGEVVGTRDVVTFQATKLDDLGDAFRASVDDYLEFCKKLGQEPERPFSGKFVTRISPKVHKDLAILAEATGKSLNQLVCECLESFLQSAATAHAAPAEYRKSVKQSEKGRRGLRRGKATRPRPSTH